MPNAAIVPAVDQDDGTARPASRSSYPEPAKAHFALLILALVAFFVSMDTNISSLLLEPMKHELRLTDIQVGIVQGVAFGATYGLCAIPMGMVIDRVRRLPLMLMSLISWSGAMALAGLSHSLGLLVVSRVALGVVTAFLAPGSLSVLSDLYRPERRAIATSIYAVGGAVGSAAAILLGGLLFDALTQFVSRSPQGLFGLTPWRTLYVGFAVLSLALTPFLARVSEPVRQEVQDASGHNRFSELWSYRAFLAPLLGGMLFLAAAAAAIASWAPPALMRLYGQTPGQFAGWMSLVTLFGGVTGALIGGQLANLGQRRCGVKGLFFPGVIAALACLPAAFVAVSPSVLTFGALMAVATVFCSAGAVVVVIGINVRMPNELRGTTLGLNVLVMALCGAGLAPTGVALATRALGGDLMLGYGIAAIAAPCALLSAFFFWLTMRSSSDGASEPS